MGTRTWANLPTSGQICPGRDHPCVYRRPARFWLFGRWASLPRSGPASKTREHPDFAGTLATFGLLAREVSLPKLRALVPIRTARPEKHSARKGPENTGQNPRTPSASPGLGTAIARRVASVSQPKTRERLSALAREILGYLERNPDACDTLVGIARWWLLKQRVHAATEDVQCALNQLMKLGLVSRNENPPGPMMYRANRENVRTKSGRKN